MLLDSIEIKNCFSDIILGYSISPEYSELFKTGEIYIKHFNCLDISKINNQKEVFVLLAKKQNLPTNESQQQYLLKETLWSEEKDNEIKKIKDFIDRLLLTKKNLVRENEVKQINSQIKESQGKLDKLETEKQNLIGFTVEVFSSKKTNEFYVKNSLYTDPEFKHPFFTEESFEDVDDNLLSSIVKIYNEKMKIFHSKNLKKTALIDDFFKMFAICNDNPFYLYGKAIVNLTHYQIETFHFAKHYKNILSQSKVSPPMDVLEDPDKLDDWFNLNQNTEKILEKANTKNASAVGIVGGSQGDIDRARGKTGGGGPDLKNLVGKSFVEIADAFNK